MDIDEVVTAARLPWQNAYAERLIRSIRRECLDHVIVWDERGLRRVLNAYVAFYLRSRTHLSLDKDAPMSRAVVPPTTGDIVSIPQVGGEYVYLAPFVEDDASVFLKTIIPSRKTTKRYLGEEPDDHEA